MADNPSPLVMTAMAREAPRTKPNELAHARTAINNQWRAFGVTPVMFDDLGEIAKAIKELPGLCQGSWAGPR